MSQLIEERTIIVAQIDCTKIDLPTIVSEILPQEERRRVENVAKEIKTTISKIGFKDVYIIGNIRLPLSFYAAVPKKDNINLETINKLLEENDFKQQLKIRETDDFKLLIPSFMPSDQVSNFQPIALLPSTMPSKPSEQNDSKQISDSKISKSPALRKEFVEASKAIENYPIKIFVFIPDFVKRVYNEIKPTILPDNKQVDFSVLFNQFRWFAIGIDPAKSEIHVVIETQNENKTKIFATELNNLFETGYDTITKLIKSENFLDDFLDTLELDVDSDVVKSIITQSKIIIKYLKPKIQGKSIVLHLSSKDIWELLKTNFRRNAGVPPA
jgi:hypothetical protein